MAKQITDLPAYSAPVDADLVLVRNSGSGVDSKTTFQEFLEAITGNALFPFPRGHLINGEIQNNSIDVLKDIDFLPGQARDADDTENLVLSSTLVKQLDAAWAIGTNQGGLFTGAIAANTTYHCFWIRRDSDGVIDAGFDTDVGAANIPSGWTAYRRVGSIVTDATPDIIAFHQYGDRFVWDTPVADLSAVSIGTGSRTAYAMTLPPDVIGLFQGRLVSAAAVQTTYVLATSSDQPDTAVTGSNFTLVNSNEFATADSDASPFECAVDSSQQINLRSDVARNVFILTLGWLDTRGKDGGS